MRTITHRIIFVLFISLKPALIATSGRYTLSTENVDNSVDSVDKYLKWSTEFNALWDCTVNKHDL
jgi:hypothetical protein